MTYQSLARKWRPQTFGDMVGQPVVSKALQNALRQKRIAHGYLFAGMRGTGKTTAARIMAKALNCEQGPTATPCNTCGPCQEITSGRAPDVLEIDAASHNGVDDIRKLQETLMYQGALRYRVVILDEAHMLSDAAENAFLKTLEEPPDQTVFILATTELHKIKETIQSRCQCFEFRRIASADILARLKTIAQEENIQVSDSALNMMVRAGEGSLRDPIVTLDQLVSFVGSDIKDADVASILGIVESELLSAFAEAILHEDSGEILALAHRLIAHGHDLERFCQAFIGFLRDLLVVRAVPDAAGILALSKPELSALQERASQFSESELLRALDVLIRLSKDMRYARQPRFLLEAALIKLVHLKRLSSLESMFAQGVPSAPAPASGPTENRSAPPAASGPPLSSEEAGPAAFEKPSESLSPPLSVSLKPSISITSLTSVKPAISPEDSAARSLDELSLFMQQVELEKPALAGYLEHASRLDLSADTLDIFFSDSHKSLASTLSQKDWKGAMQRIASHVTGRSIRIEFKAFTPSSKDLEIFDEQSREHLKKERVEDLALNDPLVQKVMKRFEAKLVEVD